MRNAFEKVLLYLKFIWDSDCSIAIIRQFSILEKYFAVTIDFVVNFLMKLVYK